YAAQTFCDPLVKRCQPGPSIQDEENDMSLTDGGLDLPFDCLREVVGVLNPHASRIHQLEDAWENLHNRRNTVARDPGGRLDDGNTLSRERVEKRGLSHIGSAYDRDHGCRHGLPLSCSEVIS